MPLFVCKKCGECCRVMFVDLDKKPSKDWTRWVNFHEGARIVKQEGKWLLRLELKCLKLKNNQCSIYKNRPKLCKEYNCWEKGFPK